MRLTNSQFIPSSVYRIQLSGDFPIKKVIEILPYLKELGVEGIYCSPFYDAFSSHGYDVTNPNIFNPLLGSMEDYDKFFDELKRLKLKIIIDVIPNHMGIKGGKNAWWQDVLENGPYSTFASFFDINWTSEKKELQDRVLLPILGKSYGEAIENQEIQLSYSDGTFLLHYMDFPLPVRLHSYSLLLEFESHNLKSTLGEEHPAWKEYAEILDIYRFFPTSTNQRNEKKEEGKKRLSHLFQSSKEVHKHIQHVVSAYNGKKRVHDSFDLLDKLLEAQFYRLSYWKVASHEINYRRFFNIHELVAIRIEEEPVLNLHHHLVFELMDSGKIHGLRIDHPDGLYDPIKYFDRLRKKLPLYTVVEKILDPNEELPELWQVEGTVGYEFLALLNSMFIYAKSEQAFSEIYEGFIQKKILYEEVLYQSKKRIASHEMISEVKALGLTLDGLSETAREYRDFTRHDLTLALSEVIACFPVYRTYIDTRCKPNQHEIRYIKTAIDMAKRKASTQIDSSIFDFIEKVLLVEFKCEEKEVEGYLDFVMRFQQLTGPMMAKGLEDTTFYIYNRFISLNEVGSNPTLFGKSPSKFHKFNIQKRQKWPFGFLASSTHDTKRSEDARMRLNVLSEMPGKWKKEVNRWAELTKPFKTLGPTPNDEYQIYQILLAIWPRRELKKEEEDLFVERVWQIVLKSIREAKEETGWMVENQLYEEAVKQFIFSILTVEKDNQFLKEFTHFQKELDWFGAWNSLSATLLKMGSCGVVDIYQGNETLTYRLVDPDNRTSVNFDKRKALLDAIQKEGTSTAIESNDFEKLKLFLHTKALHFRLENKDLFLSGEYIPLGVKGSKRGHIVAFLRRFEKSILIVIVGRFFSLLTKGAKETPIGEMWGNTEIVLPKELEITNLKEYFTDNTISVKTKKGIKTVLASEVFKTLPVAYLIAEL